MPISSLKKWSDSTAFNSVSSWFYFHFPVLGTLIQSTGNKISSIDCHPPRNESLDQTSEIAQLNSISVMCRVVIRSLERSASLGRIRLLQCRECHHMRHAFLPRLHHAPPVQLRYDRNGCKVGLVLGRAAGAPLFAEESFFCIGCGID